MTATLPTTRGGRQRAGRDGVRAQTPDTIRRVELSLDEGPLADDGRFVHSDDVH